MIDEEQILGSLPRLILVSSDDKTNMNQLTIDIKQWGNSAAIRLPKQALEALDADVGTQMQLTINDNVLTLKPKRVAPTIEELLSLLKPEHRHKSLFDDAIGEELL